MLNEELCVFVLFLSQSIVVFNKEMLFLLGEPLVPVDLGI